MPGQRQRNGLLRFHRELRGWSLDDVASGLHQVAASLGEEEPGVDATTVSRWERGVRRPRPRYVRLLSRLFELPADQLGLVNRFEPGADPVPGSGRPAPDAPEPEDPTATELEEMERREFIRKLTTAFGTALLPPALDQLGPEPWTALARALKRPPALDRGTLDELESRTIGLHLLEQRIPARQLADGVVRHLHVLTHLLEFTHSPTARSRLAVLAGETAVLAGWLAFDRRDHVRARAYYAVALDAAREAGDEPLAACALGYLSYLTSLEGAAGEAQRLLHEARGRVGATYPATRAWLAGREAEELAIMGDTLASLDVLERAYAEFERARPEEERSWTRFLDRSRFESLAVATYARLGEADAALTAGEEAMAALAGPDFKKRAIVLADVAIAYARRGEAEAACELGGEALAIGLRTESRLGLQRVRELRHRLEPWNGARAVRDLDRQLQAVGTAGS
ncbi:MAG TPA: helix-turn-helix transcriptional regulator [Candidatus Dormibacteraeota bacterium]|nr:helix-turn-helix transcriptional regulator [Candidatus Dormibacteraeota bacterium]